jgi:CRISPR-associated protein Csm5
MKMSKKIYNFQIKIKSPVHIGCGEEFDVINFYIDREKKKLINFNVSDFISKLNERGKLNEFENKCKSGDLKTVVSFINEFFKNNENRVAGYELEVPNDLIEHYDRCLETPNLFNQFQIFRTTYLPYNNMPYIPGSSIKGALRTAFLEYKRENKNMNDIHNFMYRDYKGKTKYNIRGLERNLLGGNENVDIFSCVKVSDFLPKNGVKRKVVYALNFYKNSDKQTKNLYQTLEVITEGTFNGTIEIISKDNLNRDFQEISIEKLLDACKKYYKNYNNNQNLNNSVIIKMGIHKGIEYLTLKFKGINKTAITEWLSSDTRKPGNKSNLKEFGIIEIINNGNLL